MPQVICLHDTPFCQEQPYLFFMHMLPVTKQVQATSDYILQTWSTKEENKYSGDWKHLLPYFLQLTMLVEQNSYKELNVLADRSTSHYS